MRDVHDSGIGRNAHHNGPANRNGVIGCAKVRHENDGRMRRLIYRYGVCFRLRFRTSRQKHKRHQKCRNNTNAYCPFHCFPQFHWSARFA